MAENMPREDRHLVRALHALGEEIDYPRTPDLATQVSRRLEGGSERLRARRFVPQLSARRVLAVAALALAVAVAAAALTPEVRSAVAGWLGVLGIEIRVEEGPGPALHGKAQLGLGHEMGLEQARRAVSFPVATFHAPGFTTPDVVLLADAPPGGRVSFVYRPRPDLPEVAGTGAGLLLSQFEATLGEALIKKVVSTDTSVDRVALGEGGYWISGPPHFIAYVDARGMVRDETTRLAANTLVWERNGVTFRLESRLGEARTLRLARSLS
jgi:hypothetical protein